MYKSKNNAFYRLSTFVSTVIAKAISISICVAFSNKVMDTPELPQPIKRHEAPKYDVCSVGRSMIEMLGVLAIIGVLSVGGIAGYSKAMQMYKLNKWKDDFVTLTANLKVSFMNSKSYTETDNQNLTNFFKQVGVVPQNMLDAQNHDIFGNELRIWSYSLPSWGIGSRLFLHFWTQPNQNSVEECKELFIALSEYDDAWAVVLNEQVTGRTGGILTVCGKAAPMSYCQRMGGIDFNLANVAAKCAVCAKQRCDIIFLLSNGV